MLVSTVITGHNGANATNQVVTVELADPDSMNNFEKSNTMIDKPTTFNESRNFGADSRHAISPRQHVEGIRLDLRWRGEMARGDLALFDRLAGDFNREYRWDG